MSRSTSTATGRCLGHGVREDEVEVLGAEGRPGDSLDLLQHERPDKSVRGGAGADRLPGPAEPEVRQVHVDPEEVQGRGQRGEHRPRDGAPEEEACQHGEGRPLRPARHERAARPAATPARLLRRLVPRWIRERQRALVELGGRECRGEIGAPRLLGGCGLWPGGALDHDTDHDGSPALSVVHTRAG